MTEATFQVSIPLIELDGTPVGSAVVADGAPAHGDTRPAWSGLDRRDTLARFMDDLYRDYILEHYRRPHNFGPIEGATASHEGANPLCGDRITLQMRVLGGKVDGVGFTGRGCAISQASASLLTDEIKGKPLTHAAGMAPKDVLDLLGIDISPARMKCAMLSYDTLQKTLADMSEPATAGREASA